MLKDIFSMRTVASISWIYATVGDLKMWAKSVLLISGLFLVVSCTQAKYTTPNTETQTPSASGIVENQFQEKAKSLVKIFLSACVETNLNKQEISDFAENNGWSRFAEAELKGTGRAIWITSELVRIEIRESVYPTTDLFICSVSTLGKSTIIDEARLETQVIRNVLEKDWELRPIKDIPPVGLPDDLPDALRPTDEKSATFEQYNFLFSPKKETSLNATFKFGYLWANGEHRLNASRDNS